MQVSCFYSVGYVVFVDIGTESGCGCFIYARCLVGSFLFPVDSIPRSDLISISFALARALVLVDSPEDVWNLISLHLMLQARCFMLLYHSQVKICLHPMCQRFWVCMSL